MLQNNIAQLKQADFKRVTAKKTHTHTKTERPQKNLSISILNPVRPPYPYSSLIQMKCLVPVGQTKTPVFCLAVFFPPWHLTQHFN